MSEQPQEWECIESSGIKTWPKYWNPIEQPQEWTQESVERLTGYAVVGLDGKLIADAHNAALAAAFKRGRLEGVFASPDEGEVNYVRGLEQQLAAERQARCDAEEEVIEWEKARDDALSKEGK